MLINRFFLTKFLFVLLFLSCEGSQNLKEFGKQLANQSTPSNFVSSFVENAIFLPPDDYLFWCYDRLTSMWQYVEESGADDEIQSAEEMIKNQLYKGDCEDFSVLMMAFCRIRNLDAVFCLGKNLEIKGSGHIWIEVPICKRDEYKDNLKRRIKNNLRSDITLSIRDEMIWLSFIGSDARGKYLLEYTVDAAGALRSVDDFESCK